MIFNQSNTIELDVYQTADCEVSTEQNESTFGVQSEYQMTTYLVKGPIKPL